MSEERLRKENQKKLHTSNGNEFTKYELLDDYERILQENQQLKDRNKLLKKHYKQGEKNLGTQIDITLKYEKVLDEIREQLKLERKLALSLNKPYTVSVIDKLLDKVKE